MELERSGKEKKRDAILETFPQYGEGNRFRKDIKNSEKKKEKSFLQILLCMEEREKDKMRVRPEGSRKFKGQKHWQIPL